MGSFDLSNTIPLFKSNNTPSHSFPFPIFFTQITNKEYRIYLTKTKRTRDTADETRLLCFVFSSSYHSPVPSKCPYLCNLITHKSSKVYHLNHNSHVVTFVLETLTFRFESQLPVHKALPSADIPKQLIRFLCESCSSPKSNTICMQINPHIRMGQKNNFHHHSYLMLFSLPLPKEYPKRSRRCCSRNQRKEVSPRQRTQWRSQVRSHHHHVADTPGVDAPS